MLLPRLVPGQIMMPRNPILSITAQRSGVGAAEAGAGALETCGYTASTRRAGASRFTPVLVELRLTISLPPARSKIKPHQLPDHVEIGSYGPCRQPVTQCAHMQSCGPSLRARPKSKDCAQGLGCAETTALGRHEVGNFIYMASRLWRPSCLKRQSRGRNASRVSRGQLPVCYREGTYTRPGRFTVRCSQYSVFALGRGSVGYARGRSKQYRGSIYFKEQLGKAFCRCAMDGSYRKKRAKGNYWVSETVGRGRRFPRPM